MIQTSKNGTNSVPLKVPNRLVKNRADQTVGVPSERGYRLRINNYRLHPMEIQTMGSNIKNEDPKCENRDKPDDWPRNILHIDSQAHPSHSEGNDRHG